VPTTLVGLFVFVAFLTPGLVYSVHRRALVPQRPLSVLVETATLVSVSLAADIAVLSLFALVRLLIPTHTPDIGALIRDGSSYAQARPAYIFGWSAALLAASCAVGITGARWQRLRSSFLGAFAPSIVDTSAWYYVFEDEPPLDYRAVYVACDMKDGSYLAGILAWYSTETAETADRDLVLAPPLLRRSGGKVDSLEGFGRAIVSARDVATIYVSWLTDDGLAALSHPAPKRNRPASTSRRANPRQTPQRRRT